jgi:L-threonylcarbamoyladenylate synthase
MRLDGHDAAALDRAAALLVAGGLVAFPTETVYGLGARADDDAAVATIFRAKGRPADHPLIVHVAGIGAADAYAARMPAVARRLIDAFWPGPLTVIVPRRDGMAAVAAGGQSSIGLRCPAHPVAQALLARCAALGAAGIAAPSANRYGRISPTDAAHVEAEFGADLVVVDGGACSVGIESAIVDCSRDRPVLLRPGVVSRALIEAAAGEPLHAADRDAPRAPGTLAAHYAPNAKLRLMPVGALHAALRSRPPGGTLLAVYSFATVAGAAADVEDGPSGGRRNGETHGGVGGAQGGVQQRRMPTDPEVAARELFAVLRAFDAAGVEAIWVEEPPPDPAWDGVRDRLRRAATAR